MVKSSTQPNTFELVGLCERFFWTPQNRIDHKCPNSTTVRVSMKLYWSSIENSDEIFFFKVPVRSNFPKFMFVDFSKVYAAVTYHAKPFFNPSTRSPFFFHGISRILCPPLIGHVPTAQYEA